jgi:4-coumarate--CoA ligase
LNSKLYHPSNSIFKMADKILHGPKKDSYAEITSLGEFFFNQAERYGNNICQVDANINKSETYSSVKLRSVRLAIALQHRGLTSKDVVLSCSKNTLDNAIPIIASLYLGAKVISLDPSLGTKNSKYLVGLVSPRIIFVEEVSVDMIESSLDESNVNPEIIVLGNSDKYAKFSDLTNPKEGEDKFRPVKVDIHDTAVMLYSSGTTGLPKAICHSHHSFLQSVYLRKNFGYDDNSILHFTTFYWISGMGILCRTFLDGGTRVFCGDVEGETILRIIQDYKLAAVFMSTFHTYKLTRINKSKVAKYDTSSLHYIMTGGTSITAGQYRRLKALFPNVQIIFVYGMTEIGRISGFYPEIDRDFMSSKLTSCGRVAPETSLKIVNPETDDTLGPNHMGEVRVKSPSMMTGYYNLDSSQYFDNDSFLKTGDLGYYDDDKCLYVVGRLKEIFKYKSWHIVPSSVESVVLEHPAVKEAVVVGVPREEEGEVPAACVVLKEGFSAGKDEIEEFVAERVSDREKLRAGIVFVRELPKTPSGKVIRKDVQEWVVKVLNDLNN